MRQPPLLFASQSYELLGQRLAEESDVEVGEVEARQFPDGERYRRITTACRGRDVILLGGTITDSDTLALYDVACALVYYGARRLSILLPFFGYSTMERAMRPGEVVTAKTRARLLSSIPPAAMGNEIIMLDLHVQGITHYFEGSMQPRHVSARPLIAELARSLGGDDFVLACTDAGRAKWVEALANELGVACAFAYKRRLDGASTEVIDVSANVSGKKVVIYDDMIRTGSSLVGSAEAYRNAGATSVSALTTHGVFPADALETLRDSGMFSSIVCTDSHPRASELAGDFLQVHSISKLLTNSLVDHGMWGESE
ncbi:MAG: ribose-phosphate pyrophosphokinase [Myxococcales bacterium]|nr:ribose-phosphate pyrophosphokinase [Myxococcales bacterium]